MAQQPQQQQDVPRDTLLAGSTSVPFQQLWHTLKPDDWKDKFTFFLSTKELVFLVDDLIRIFELPQATDNNNVGFVIAPSFGQMIPFFHNVLRFSIPMRLPSHCVSKGLPQPGQALVKIFTRCLTT
ncbi:hypothetical protein Tco_1084733 [Tanacetum coccineum]